MPDPPPLSGFVTDYINTFAAATGRAPGYDDYKIIMDGFTPDRVPVLSMLAHRYAVCDRWHCSVPSQTFCNRSFVHSATSNGFVVNAPYVNWLFTDSETIFNRIEDDPRPDLTWKVYFDIQDGLSITWLLQPRLWQYRQTRFFEMAQFYQDAAAGTLPSYAFIEPRLLIDHNDQHPPTGDLGVTSSVLAGELLIHDVYQSLRHGRNWEKTLFVITYDEHGGCYDHTPPPPAVPPDPHRLSGQFGFAFDRLGVRVPTVVVSPYIEAGTVVNTLFDHTSIIKTITRRWGLNNITERDAAAADMSELLTRSTPRQDFPEIIPRPYIPTGPPENEPLSNLQRAILAAVAGWQGLDRIDKDKYSLAKLLDAVEVAEEEIEIAFELKTTGDAAAFIKKHLTPSGQRGCLGQLTKIFTRT
jgi:phospholipase C